VQGRVGFAPEFVSYVLEPLFEGAKAFFISPLMAIHHAHLAMLVEQGIISRADGRTVAAALETVSRADFQHTTHDGTCEDLFFHVERLIVAAAGEQAAGRLHTARSRNDIDMTMYRMRQREMILGLIEATARLRGVLLDLAERHREDVFPAHTHTQPAQPTTIAHYLLAVVEQLERDTVRVKAAFVSTNRNPLGACAITGTGFPIDRERTSVLLGFDGTSGNTYGSVATVDYLLESVSAASVLLTGLGRVLQDLLLWCTAEVGYLRLADGFVQRSSIMPQKRNPVALEHARAIASKAVGQALAIAVTVHNTPFGDIVDTEDDLQPLVFETFHDAIRAVQLVAASLAPAAFDTDRMSRRAAEAWITLTELADALTRDRNIPFTISHRIASRLPAASDAAPNEPLESVLDRVAIETRGEPIGYTAQELAEILSPAHFVRVRRTPGGPAPDQTTRAIAHSRERLTADTRWFESTMGRLRAAEEELKRAVAAI
jgi:argininosuccinate lyase